MERRAYFYMDSLAAASPTWLDSTSTKTGKSLVEECSGSQPSQRKKDTTPFGTSSKRLSVETNQKCVTASMATTLSRWSRPGLRAGRSGFWSLMASRLKKMKTLRIFRISYRTVEIRALSTSQELGTLSLSNDCYGHFLSKLDP